MSRGTLYPEGSTSVHAVVPVTVKAGLQGAAMKQRVSMSHLVTVILESWLRERGELPVREPQEAAV